MFDSLYLKKSKVHEAKKFDITVIVRIFVEELIKKKMKYDTKIDTEHEVIRIKEFFNIVGHNFDTPFLIYNRNSELPEIDFIPSNLGKGYVFYFLCNGCDKKVRHLYLPYEYSSILCRECHHLRYKQPDRKTRRLSRLIHKPYLSQDDKERVIEMIKQK